ncbi:hypothetical protein [Trichocoleus sp. FACHB-262]|uniref:hypothetical protein n=1 Tax=Trichocoleus sp. FACHB-262 TaxID=2692869 RepID=UPI00168A1E27|nr:hypothetical protein [Trichocoleus sp. FACHB-262]MBD2120018.1 hypothetical protein [Trichocoleus sp. FACHB-262]
MTNKLPPVYFYLPQADWTDDMTDNADTYWVGFRRGVYCWTLQTYLRLNASGFPCQLISTLPDEGIILAHWDSLPPDLQPGPKQMIVCFQADRARHPYAQIHVVQNPLALSLKTMTLGDRFLLPGDRYFLPLWPQPGLIPRDPSRGDRFENIAFFGLEENIVPELRTASWREQLANLGLNWRVVSDFDLWNNYSEIDAILAIRSFGRQEYSWKPASKLYNAWHAGVPAILGYDSAFRHERKSELDYLEVLSLADTLQALAKLQGNSELRRNIIQNGRCRAVETFPTELTKRWQTFLEAVAIPAYHRWCTSPNLVKKSFLLRRRLAIQTKDSRKNLQKLRNRFGIRSRLKSLIPKA